MTRYPVITAAANVLAHAPGLVRYGSRPVRDIVRDASILQTLPKHLRSYEEAVGYTPNQVYVGSLDPDTLRGKPRPWFSAPDLSASSTGPFGDIVTEAELLGLLKLCDRARLVQLEEGTLTAAAARLSARGVVTEAELAVLEPATPPLVERTVATGVGLPLWRDANVVGSIARGHEDDEALTANVLLENLVAKATAVLALRTLLNQVKARLGPDDIEFVISGSEEAVGDRYQRGGGNVAKAVAEQAGLSRATGFDVKDFCASTLHAVFNAAALIQAGVFRRVVVVAGCSLAKLGMKYRAHVAKQMPILEDMLAGVAVLIERDGDGPVLRLDTLGLHTVSTGSSQQAAVEALVMGPLDRAGCKLIDVDRYATEMHNPEVTEPAGSGDVPTGNYRLIAALGAMRGDLPRSGINDFINRHGMPGFSPTQGHIASAVCYMPHALHALRSGAMKRVLFMAKGSLFLGRLTQLSDGVSFLVES